MACHSGLRDNLTLKMEVVIRLRSAHSIVRRLGNLDPKTALNNKFS